MHFRRTTCVAALAFAALSAGSAAADVITTYTNGNTWISNLTSTLHTEASAFSSGPISNSLIAGSYGTFFASGALIGAGNPIHSVVQDQTGTMTITAPSGGTNALLLYLGANQAGAVSYSSSELLTITLTDSFGNAQVFTLSTGSASPWAFTSDTSITTITIAAPSGYDVDLADFFAGSFPNTGGSQSSGGQAPECATLLLMGGGLLLVGARRKVARPIPC